MKRSTYEIEALVDELAEHGRRDIGPSREQLRALILADRDGPLHFVNLLGFFPEAQYPEDHELSQRKMSGADAYALYGAVALKHVRQRGGRLVSLNSAEQTLLGPDGNGHQVAVMQYPNTDAFLDMLQDPDYLAAIVHRDAGLGSTGVIVTRPIVPAP